MPRTLELLGHRGARGLVAENTLASFARALEIGVHGLEIDIHLSHDGVVVVHHDPCLNLEMTQDAKGQWLEHPTPAINALSFEALQQYRLCEPRPGSKHAGLFPHQQINSNERIPRLEQLIELIHASRNEQLRLIIEMKMDVRIPHSESTVHRLCDSVVEVLSHHSMLQRSCLHSFNWALIQYTQEHYPTVSCAFLSAERVDWNTISGYGSAGSPWTGRFQIHDYENNLPAMVHAAGGRIWAPDYRSINAETLAQAHALGLQVIVWTVNDPQDMLSVMTLGVDGIITDYPDRLRKLMQTHGYDLPAPSQSPDPMIQNLKAIQ
jgi:glycerophosphoryl diester phosphodiesterase